MIRIGTFFHRRKFVVPVTTVSASSLSSSSSRQTLCHQNRFFVLSRSFHQTIGLFENAHTSKNKIYGTIPEFGKGIELGQYAEVERSFSVDDVKNFGLIVHDDNILHTSMTWEETIKEMPFLLSHEKSGLIQFVQRQQQQQDDDDDDDDDTNEITRKATTTTKGLVHGMLVSSLFSSIFGTLSPGAVYLNQSLDFIGPVFIDEIVRGRVEITKLRRKRHNDGFVVECDTQVFKYEKAVVTGTANVWLPTATKKQ